MEIDQTFGQMNKFPKWGNEKSLICRIRRWKVVFISDDGLGRSQPGT